VWSQELLAAQLIQAFADIFRECSLPLYLRPYEVLVTSNRTALIELVPDSLSVHTIKSKSAPNASLADHFFDMFPRCTPACEAAQRAFAESMAGYSLVCYLLQIKVPPPQLSRCGSLSVSKPQRCVDMCRVSWPYLVNP
jgi:phosphatidylinositol 4-kinase